MSWNSRPTCDYETLIAFAIICNPYPTPMKTVDVLLSAMVEERGSTVIADDPPLARQLQLRTYRGLAEKMAAQTYEYLCRCLSDPNAFGFRLTLAGDKAAREVRATHVLHHD